MIAKQFVETNDVQTGETMLVKMVSMLFGLIRTNSDVRVFETPEHYGEGEGIGIRVGLRIGITRCLN
jgi:hypothetical protein